MSSGLALSTNAFGAARGSPISPMRFHLPRARWCPCTRNRPHLHRDKWAHPAHICTATNGRTPPTSVLKPTGADRTYSGGGQRSRAHTQSRHLSDGPPVAPYSERLSGGKSLSSNGRSTLRRESLLIVVATFSYCRATTISASAAQREDGAETPRRNDQRFGVRVTMRASDGTHERCDRQTGIGARARAGEQLQRVLANTVARGEVWCTRRPIVWEQRRRNLCTQQTHVRHRSTLSRNYQSHSGLRS